MAYPQQNYAGGWKLKSKSKPEDSLDQMVRLFKIAKVLNKYQPLEANQCPATPANLPDDAQKTTDEQTDVGCEDA